MAYGELSVEQADTSCHRQGGHGTGKTGNLVVIFLDRENTGNLRNLRKDRGFGQKWIIFRFQFRFKFEVENFIVVTIVIEHIFACKKHRQKL